MKKTQKPSTKVIAKLLKATALTSFLATYAAHAFIIPVSDDTVSTVISGNETLKATSSKMPTLIVRNNNRAFVKFPFSNPAVLPGSIEPEHIESATLQFFITSVRNPSNLKISALTSNWSEATNGAPPTTGSVLATVPAADLANNKFISVDVTSAVKSQLATGDFGFVLQAVSATTQISFSAKDGSQAGSSARVIINANPRIWSQSDSIFLGFLAGNFSATGFSNTGLGESVLLSLGNGTNNVAVGKDCLRDLTTGNLNTGIGLSSLSLLTSGEANVGVGAVTLPFASGSYNTAAGAYALYNLLTGNNNIAVGYGSGAMLGNGTNNIYIGNGGQAAESNTVRIGGGAITSTFIAGIRGVTTGVADAIPVLIDSMGQLGTISSSRRYKENIEDMGAVSERLLKLRPRTFCYKKPFADGSKPVQFGLVAEEVAEVFPELVVYDEQGEPETVKYQDLAILLLNEFLKEKAQSEQNAKRIASLESQLMDVRQAIAQMAEEAAGIRQARLTKAP